MANNEVLVVEMSVFITDNCWFVLITSNGCVTIAAKQPDVAPEEKVTNG